MKLWSLTILLLAISACHKEPPIVIKFEPMDAATSRGTVAATDAGSTTTATAPALPDAGARAESAAAAAPSARKDAKPGECKAASDCEVVPVECCDCANGGQQEAVPHKRATAIKAQRTGPKCKDVMCTMMVSTDPTCGKAADCVDGRCVMVQKQGGKKLVP